MRSKILLKLLIISLIFAGSIFVGAKNKLYLKSILRKQPTIFRFVQKGEKVVSHFWNQKFKKTHLKNKAKFVEISVDANIVVEKFKRFWGGFGHDQFYSGVVDPKNREFFKLIKDINKDGSAFTYYRAHNIFSDINNSSSKNCGGEVYSEDAAGNPQYNWTKVNKVFDTILSANMKPIVEFSFMPTALASDKKRIGDWRKANVSPPKDYYKWSELVFQTVKHLQNRYGANEIQKWYFEVWNEPDLWRHFWVPNPKDEDKTDLNSYLKLYDFTVAGAIRANPNIKIGGPAIAGWPYVLEGFFKHVSTGKNYFTGKKGAKTDFYSFHKYGDIDKTILANTKFYRDMALFVDKNKFSKTPFLIGEFGASGTRYKQKWKNTPYLAAWLCKTIDGMFDLSDKHGKEYRPASMIYWSQVGENFQKGGGALATSIGRNKNQIVKGPVFNTYHLLSYLSSQRIALQGTQYGDYVHGIATKNDRLGSVQIMLYHIDDRYRKNSQFQDTVKVDLEIKNLKSNSYYLKKYSIDHLHANAYGLWKKLGSPSNPTQEQITLLQSNDDIELVQPIEQLKPSGGICRLAFPLESNSVVLLILSEVKNFNKPLPPRKLTAEKIGTNSMTITWQSPPGVSSGKKTQSYLIMRNGEKICSTWNNYYKDSGLKDNTDYFYQIYSVDGEGNLSELPLNGKFRTLRDSLPPRIVSFRMESPSKIVIEFNEPLLKKSVRKENFFISNGVKIKSIVLFGNAQKIILTTDPHGKGIEYIFEMSNLMDCAKTPNILRNYKRKYQYYQGYSDNFDVNTLSQYNIPSEGKTERSKVTYDAQNKRLSIFTGDNDFKRISKSLPTGKTGRFLITFYPLRKYPVGGVFSLKLMENSLTYYNISNTDGYNPGVIEKYVDGKLVDRAHFQKNYVQNKQYKISVDFSPVLLSIEAFGENARLVKSSAPIRISSFELKVIQQDCFIDEIYYEVRN